MTPILLLMNTFFTLVHLLRYWKVIETISDVVIRFSKGSFTTDSHVLPRNWRLTFQVCYRSLLTMLSCTRLCPLRHLQMISKALITILY